MPSTFFFSHAVVQRLRICQKRILGYIIFHTTTTITMFFCLAGSFRVAFIAIQEYSTNNNKSLFRGL